ncbi:MAG TPA: FtsX-like permease family protein [Deltaproteobacteria bacterium]|jgi:ABC-type antimicrobial peptide transport system permease subunit|nr:FtsX-like permease family protein [Deltaproteobacteria bacterium]
MLLFYYSYRNLLVRRLTTLLTAGGMGLVIFVFATVLMLAEGFQQTLITSGSPENAVFIRRSAETEVQSIIERKDAAIIESMSQVAVDKDRRRLAAREAVLLISLPKKDTGLPSNVQVRGVTHGVSLELRSQIKIVAGREFNAGSSEILIGRNIAKKFRVPGLGGTINFVGRAWTVAGIMEASGTAFDSEIWGDVDTLMGAFKRPVYSSVIIRMRDPSALPELKETVLKDPRLVEEARREDQYYEAQSELMARFIRILGISLTLIFSLGAITGSMITMYAAVAARTSEIGTLRALGFRRVFILLAFLAEALFLSLLGAAIGLAGASFMNKLTISTMNWTTFSELSFRFLLDRRIIASSVLFAVVMGIVGGALPSIRAARMNIVSALRAR